jgi:recombination protein RecT
MSDQNNQPPLTPDQQKALEEKQKRELYIQKQNNVNSLLEKYKGSIAQALPSFLTVDRMVRVFLTAISRTPGLMDCTQHSLMSAVLTCSQLGLSPDSILGEAFLIPFKNKKKKITECQLIIGYKGLLGLARRSGQMQRIGARPVFAAQSILKGDDLLQAVASGKEVGDYFKYSFGLDETLEHEPGSITDADRITHFYSVAKFTNGGHIFNVMTRKQVEKVRDESPNYKYAEYKNSTVWATAFEEMGNKTVLRRMMKFLPLSPDLQRAIGLDEAAEYGSQPIAPELLDDLATDQEMKDAVNAEIMTESEQKDQGTGGNMTAEEKAAAATKDATDKLNK